MSTKLQEQLQKKYGRKNGTRIYMTIMPGILADFKKMLKAAAPGEVISETYKFEDGDGAVFVSGSCSAEGELSIEASFREAEK